MADTDPIDIVYTWVDDRFAGYQELVGRYAKSGHDLNPNRTRDNLDLLKYSLRSLAANGPPVRNVHIVSCAPQIPPWLDTGADGLKLIHDEIIDSEFLPTFNSFAILSSVHRIPGLTRRFLYVEDDMLFGAPLSLADFADAADSLRIFPRLGVTRGAAQRDRDDLSPWNTSLAYSNHLLDTAFGARRRRYVNHVPILIDRDWWQEMIERWSGEFRHTRASRFRAKHNVAPEFLYPYFLLYTGRANCGPVFETYRDTGYVPLENAPLTSWFALERVRALKPKIVALNDGFGENPRPSIVAMARAYLESSFPVKSRFEI
jgi:hypothetical protein